MISMSTIVCALLALFAASEARAGSPTHEDAAQIAPRTIALGCSGYSPVSYLDLNRAEPGSPRFRGEYAGVTYFFTSAAQREAFDRNPNRYLPAYGGYCAFGCSVGSQFEPDPESFEIIDGRTHLFLKNAEVDAKALWEKESPDAVRAKADAYWSKVSGG